MFCFLFFFKTLKNASKLRRDGLLENFEMIPDDGGYHRQCYSSYTNTKSLPRPESSDAPSTTTVKRRKTESSTLAPNICIICRTKRCNKKGKTGHEVLTMRNRWYGICPSKLRLILWSCNTWICWSFNLTNNCKIVQAPSNMLSRSYTLKVSIYSKWTRNWRGQYSGILLCWNSGICVRLCY